MKPLELQPLPPSGLDWQALMPLIGEANRAVAKFGALLDSLPNPIVFLSPLTTQEAVLSSKIEGTQADVKDVLESEVGSPPETPSRREDVREIMNYQSALHRCEQLLEERPFCLNSVLELHRILMASARGHNKGPGTFRTVQNWIGKKGSLIEEASFVPPSPENVPWDLDAWEKYWHTDAPDVLIQLALLHAQFESIHPFIDGNGRIGRILIPIFLYEKKILSRPCFYISAYMEAHRDEYINCLGNLGASGGWTSWCQFFLKGVVAQAEENIRTVFAIRELYEQLKEKVIALTHSQFAVPLLDHIFEHPVFRSSAIHKLSNMPSPPTVLSHLNKLERGGIIKTLRKGAGSRPHVFVFARLINLCEGKEVF